MRVLLIQCNYGNEGMNGRDIQTKFKEEFIRNNCRMSFTPPEAPPYPISPDDEHQDEEGSTAAYAEILVCLKK